MHHPALDGPGPHDRHLDHQVVELLGLEPRQHAALRPALDLEHADRLGALDHLVGGLVLGRDVLDLEGTSLALADEVQRLADRRQHAQPQHVDLEQPDRVEVVLVPLDHRAVRHRRVLHRHHARQRPLRQHEAARVLRQVTREAEQLRGDLHQLPHRQVVGVQARFAQPLRVDGLAVPPLVVAAQRVQGLRLETQRLADVAQRALDPVRDHHRRQRRALARVLAVEVLDDLLAALVLEVDVDVGRLVALLADEALEQHLHPLRIDLGHVGAVADDGVGRAAAPLAQDALRAREVDDVGHGEEVMLVAQFLDQRELALDLLADRRGNAVGPAPARAFVGQTAQVAGRRLAVGYDLRGVVVAQLVEREVAAVGHAQGLGQQLGREGQPEPAPRAQVALGVAVQRLAALGQRPAQPGRCQHVLQRLAAAHMHGDVADGHQRDLGQRGRLA